MNNSDTKNTRKTFTRSLIAAVVIGAISLPVAAGKNRGISNYDNATFDYAQVVSVDPLVEKYQVNQPIERCWDEQVSTQQRYPQNRHPNSKSRTPEVLGAIIGGVIGNQVGKRGGGKARDVATVAGAILGGSIGHDVKNNNRRYDSSRYGSSRYDDRYQTIRYQTVQRCEVKDSYVTKEEIVGYDVAYKYRGNVFHTQMNQHPGDKIKVKVTVNPV